MTILDVSIASALQGLGTGFLWVPISLVTFRTVPIANLPEATGAFHLLRNLGSSAHISLSVALVLHSAKASTAPKVEMNYIGG